MWIPPRQRRGFLSHCGLKFLKNKNKKRDNRRKVNINSNTWALKWMLGYRTVFCCRERFYPLIRNQAGSSSNNGRDADFFMQNVWFYRKVLVESRTRLWAGKIPCGKYIYASETRHQDHLRIPNRFSCLRLLSDCVLLFRRIPDRGTSALLLTHILYSFINKLAFIEEGKKRRGKGKRKTQGSISVYMGMGCLSSTLTRS